MPAEHIAATEPRMGRKPLHMTALPVRLAPETIARIKALVGTYGRAQFIREAVEAELQRREK